MSIFQKKSVKITIIVAIVATIIAGLFYIFSRGATKKQTFSDDKSVLEMQSKYSPVRLWLTNPDLTKSDLLVSTLYEGVGLHITKASSISPLVLESESREYKRTPFVLHNFDAGYYLAQVNEPNYNDFIELIYLEGGHSYDLQIHLQEVLEDKQDINIEGTTDSDIDAVIEETERFYQNNPLMKHLPYKSYNFKVHIPDENEVYLVELFPTANKVIAYDQYIKQLQDYRLEAMSWISSQGVDPDQLRIEWIPSE